MQSQFATMMQTQFATLQSQFANQITEQVETSMNNVRAEINNFTGKATETGEPQPLTYNADQADELEL